MADMVSKNISLLFSRNYKTMANDRKKKIYFFLIFGDPMFCIEKKTVFLHHYFS